MTERAPQPRWYGFNLLELFSTDLDWMNYFPYAAGSDFREDDFRWMRDWGFNFARLPMDYRFWSDTRDPGVIHEDKIAVIDRAIDLGERYGIHVQLNLHRAPGYCILDAAMVGDGVTFTREPVTLYTDQHAQAAFVRQWTFLATRYRGIPSTRLSFNLMNEPMTSPPPADGEDDASHAASLAGHDHVMRAAINAIRAIDPEREIVLDGFDCAVTPLGALADTGVMQSVHCYNPKPLTHYRCPWADEPDVVPTWPLLDAHGIVMCDSETLLRDLRAWEDVARNGMHVHVGETGCYQNTPHDVMLRWCIDLLSVYHHLDFSWAFWNLRGPFGVLDTLRTDVAYENWYGHQLDRPLLRLLQDAMR